MTEQPSTPSSMACSALKFSSSTASAPPSFASRRRTSRSSRSTAPPRPSLSPPPSPSHLHALALVFSFSLRTLLASSLSTPKPSDPPSALSALARPPCRPDTSQLDTLYGLELAPFVASACSCVHSLLPLARTFCSRRGTAVRLPPHFALLSLPLLLLPHELRLCCFQVRRPRASQPRSLTVSILSQTAIRERERRAPHGPGRALPQGRRCRVHSRTIAQEACHASQAQGEGSAARLEGC